VNHANEEQNRGFKLIGLLTLFVPDHEKMRVMWKSYAVECSMPSRLLDLMF
jgi:hypothetical protein